MLSRGSILGLATILAACSASRTAYENGNRAARLEDWDRAVAFYQEALEEFPENLETRIALMRATIEASHSHLREARRLRETGEELAASRELSQALLYDPTNRFAREELEELRRRLERESGSRPPVIRERIFGPEPLLDPFSSAPIQLKFAEETSLRTILEALGKLAGVNVLFDESFRDRNVTVDLQGVTFEQALELLLSTNGLFYKRIDGASTVEIRR
ncbi:MAG TPA: STN domain-containing protein [Vicinamibacteria bacterium]|nr:STN domain-containing protein [Vicinamibacteria bacterium]